LTDKYRFQSVFHILLQVVSSRAGKKTHPLNVLSVTEVQSVLTHYYVEENGVEKRPFPQMPSYAGETSVKDYTFLETKSISHKMQTLVIQSMFDSGPSEIASIVHYPISA